MTDNGAHSNICVICGRSAQQISRHLTRAHGTLGLDGYWRLVADELAQNPDKYLDTGTAHFSKLNDIAHDLETDRVQFHLCGDWLKWGPDSTSNIAIAAGRSPATARP